MTLTRARHILGVMLVSAPVLTLAAQQTPSLLPPAVDRTAVILGHVVDPGGRPVAGAVVTLQGGSTPPAEQVMTDVQGRFVFSELPGGRFTLRATKPGWVEGAYGRVRPEGPRRELTLAEGARALDVSIVTWATGTITGTVLDEAGEPLVLTPVRALVRSYLSREPRWTTVSTVLTDDKGRFVLARLTPGDYVVAVPSTVVSTPAGASMRGSFDPSNVSVVNTPFLSVRDPGMIIDSAALGPNDRSFVAGNQFVATMTPAAPGDGGGRPRIYGTTFYPDSATAAASIPITVRSGEERAGVDLQLRPARTTHVSGRIVVGSNEPLDRAILVLQDIPRAGDLAPSTDIPVAVTIGDEAGRFTCPVMPAGRYVIAAQRSYPPRSAERPKWGVLAISADEALSDVVISAHEGVSISGRLEFAAGERPSPEDVRNIRVGVEPIASPRYSTMGDSADPVPLRGIVDLDGSFVVPGVRPFDYYVRVDTPDPSRWSVRTVTLADRDVTDTVVHVADAIEDVVITLTGRPPRLSGRVTGDTGTAAPPAVIVFPADAVPLPELAANSRRSRLARADAAGAFSFPELLAGEYFVAAVPDDVTGAWATETFLRSLISTATRIQLREGDDKIVTLTMARVAR